MSTAADQTTITYPTPPELIGEPGAVVQEPEVDDDQVDEQETAPHSGYYETTAPEVRAPRRRHRWDLLGGSFTVGDEGSTIQRFRCRHCGLQARKVPTRNGRGLRLEVLPDGDTDWTAEVAPCPGASDWRIPDDVTPEVSRIRKLEDLVEQLQAEAGAFLREIEIRGELLDRVKVATGETWWHGAVDRVERDYSRAERDQSLPERDQSRAEPAPARRPLPAERPSVTHKFRIAGQKGYLTVGMYPDTGRPGEVFAVMAKQGSTIAGLLDAWCRACSMALQHGMPVEDLVEKFSHFRFEPAGFTETEGLRHADSIVDYIARWIGMRFCAPVAEAEPTQGEQP